MVVNEEIHEIDVIARMLITAKHHNLEVEVIWSFFQALRRGETDIEKAADYALNEWDL